MMDELLSHFMFFEEISVQNLSEEDDPHSSCNSIWNIDKLDSSSISKDSQNSEKDCPFASH